MRTLVLGAARSPFKDSGEGSPVWLAELDGELLLERFVKACSVLKSNRLIFAVIDQDVRRFKIDSIISLAAPDATVIRVIQETQGATCTALLAIDHIDPDDELLILNSNEFIDIDYQQAIDEFRERGLDAGAVVFRSIHPRYSYVRLDDDGYIIEAAEKHPISRYATAGFYWYRHGRDFIRAAEDMIRKDAHVDGRFFICPVFNELVLQQKKMGVIEIDPRNYHPLKSVRQVARYEADQRTDGDL